MLILFLVKLLVLWFGLIHHFMKDHLIQLLTISLTTKNFMDFSNSYQHWQIKNGFLKTKFVFKWSSINFCWTNKTKNKQILCFFLSFFFTWNAIFDEKLHLDHLHTSKPCKMFAHRYEQLAKVKRDILSIIKEYEKKDVQAIEFSFFPFVDRHLFWNLRVYTLKWLFADESKILYENGMSVINE